MFESHWRTYWVGNKTLQVETKACLEAIDDVLSVPGITCAFLGEDSTQMPFVLCFHMV